MKTQIPLTLLFIFVLTLTSQAQEKLIVPKAFKQAVAKQTRQNNGEPGANYWQNTSDYNIKVLVNVKNKTLSGTEKITYSNNSPDSLSVLVIRLYQDLFKKGMNRNSIVDVNPLDITNGVNINRLAVGGLEVDLTNGNSAKRNGTLLYIPLKEKLAPQQKIELDIAWDFHIPEYTLIRMGTIDSTSLFIGQWYPQMAVYDDLYGWDTHSYNGMAEFYNDFCNFEVEISVPDKFMVWATGEPQNLAEVLQKEYYEKYLQASSSDNIEHVITNEDLQKGRITTNYHTWKYKASNVSDFAFGISDHYLWDVSSVEVDKVSQRRTIVGVAYNKNAKHFDKVAFIAKETIKSLSEDMPGIPFPFPYLTVYNGDFGMEYPMITNVGADEGYDMTIYANSHEIVHGYFPFYVGTNETKNGWLDEGLVVFMPETMQTKLSPSLDIPRYNTKVFSFYSGREGEPAVITPTHYLDAKIYFYLNYSKTDQALRMLEMHLGKDVFKSCLQRFIERWKYKHPTPIDFFNTFSNLSKQNLNWFWQAWYFQSGGMPDLAISNVSVNNKQVNITITNKGDLPIPVSLQVYNNENLIETITKPATVWLNNKNEITLTLKQPQLITNIKLGNDLIPDANPKDNEYSLK